MRIVVLNLRKFYLKHFLCNHPVKNIIQAKKSDISDLEVVQVSHISKILNHEVDHCI